MHDGAIEHDESGSNVPSRTGDAVTSAGLRPWVPLVVAAVLLPLVVVGVRAVADGAPNPGGDLALIELHVRDVGGAETPLTGSYGRYGFDHPGPAWFVALAVPYRLLGASYTGLQVGTLVLGGLSVVAITAVVWRRGGAVPLLWAATLLAVLLRGLGPDWLADPWEPHALTLACAALLVLTADVVAGRPALLPVVGALSTLLAQAQATLATFAVAMTLLAAGRTALLGVRGRRALVTTAVVVGVLWVPPLVEELRSGPGNLSAILRSLRGADEVLGVADAARAVALELGHRPSWAGFAQPLEPFTAIVDVSAAPAVPVGLVALAVAAAVAVRRRAGDGVAMAGVVAVGIVAAVASLARLLGPLFAWIPSWTTALGFGGWLAVGWCAHLAVPAARRRAVDRVATGLLAVALGVAATAAVVDAGTRAHREDPVSEAVRRLADEASAAVGDEVVLARSSVTAEQVFGGGRVGLELLVLELERDGVDVVVDRDEAHRYCDHRARPGRATTELVLVDGDDVPPGATVVGRADPMTPAERRRRAALLGRFEPGSTPAERIRAASATPDLRPVLEELLRTPDLPQLALVRRDVAEGELAGWNEPRPRIGQRPRPRAVSR